MHRLGRELFPYDPKIKRTLWKARKCRVIIENQMKVGMDGVNQNIGEANR